MPRLSQLRQSSAVLESWAVRAKAERKATNRLRRMVPAYLSGVDNIRQRKVPFPQAIQDGKLWVIGSLGDCVRRRVHARFLCDRQRISFEREIYMLQKTL